MSAPRDLRTALARAEVLLDEAARARQTHPDDAPRADRLEDARVEVEQAAEACANPSPTLARRLQAVRSRFALQERAAPAGDLAGLVDDVQAAVAGSPWQRAGMSGAFLDAPRSLARWRGAAVAACVLLAVGVGVLGRANVSFEEGPTPRPLSDPRDELLQRFDAPPMAADAHAAPAGFLRPSPARRAMPVRTGAPIDGMPADDEAPGVAWSVKGLRSGQGYVVFHVHGRSSRVGTFQLDEGALLDAADKRFRVRLLPGGAAPDERESN